MTTTEPVTVALLATQGMTDFLANALAGLAACGVDPGNVVVGCPETQVASVGRVAERFGARVLPLAPDADDAIPEQPLDYGSLSFNDAMWMKVRLVRGLLDECDRVVFADLDVAWLRDPLPYLAAVLDRYPIAFQTEAQGVFPPAVCAGFMAFRRSERAIAFLDAMLAEDAARRRRGRRTGDQEVAQLLVDGDPSWLADIFCLPEALFPNGLGVPLLLPMAANADLTGRADPFVLHANWVVGAEAKRRMFAAIGAWHVEADDEPTAEPATMVIVYPMFDVRGDAAAAIRLWTQGQDADPTRFRVVVVAGSESADDLGHVRAALRPHDLLLQASSSGREADYWLAGAKRTSSPWVLLVEGHARPHPDCVRRLLSWIDDNPDAEALNCVVENPQAHTVSPLMRAWFSDLQGQWASSGTWPRLHRAAFAVRRDVLREAGYLEPRYGQFAPPLLSARLHAHGRRIVTVPGARVEHEDSMMSGHRDDTADYVYGELLAHAEQPADLMTDYFGAPPDAALRLLDGERSRRAATGAVRAMTRHPLRHGPALVAAVGSMAPAAVLGARGRVALGRARAQVSGWGIERLPLPDDLRLRLFLDDHRRFVRTEQLAWVSAHGRATAALSPDHAGIPVGEVAPGVLAGVHALEDHDGQALRWSEPAFVVRLALAAGAWDVRLDTGLMRPGLEAGRLAAVLGDRPVPDGGIRIEDDGAVVVAVRADRDGSYDLTVCVPPQRERGSRGRWLGLPLVAIGVHRA